MRSFTPVHLSPAWQSLQNLAQPNFPSLRELLSDVPRNASMQLDACGIHMDYSYQRVNTQAMQALHALASERCVDAQLRAMFNGEHINATEKRSVLHVALRGSHLSHPPWGEDISKQVKTQLDKVCLFAEKMRSGACQGFGDLAITDAKLEKYGITQGGLRTAILSVIKSNIQ
jgi:glucose-6-phosphate isomerase